MDGGKTSPESIPGDLPAIPDPKKPARNKQAFACAILASMTSVVLGYGKQSNLQPLLTENHSFNSYLIDSGNLAADVAVMSGAAMFIKEDLKVSDSELEILAGIINLYSLIGSIAAGRTSDWIGRRYTMVLASAIFFLGAVMMGLATNYAFLMAGRFVAGIGVGYSLMIAPVYTAEVSPVSARGFLTSFPEVFINSGVLLGYVSNFAFAGLPHHLNWRVMFLVGTVPPVFIAASVIFFMPESPRWLVLQNRLDEAAAVLAKTSDSPEEARLRLEEIKSAAVTPSSPSSGHIRGTHGEGVWRELLRPTPTVRRILVAAIGLQFFQQASGIDSVVLYGPRIFEKAGLKTNSKKLGATVAVGFTKTIFILVSTFFLDRVGRRPLLLSSAGGMILSLLALASALFVIDRRPEGEAPLAAVVVSIMTVLSFVGSFSIGLGPIAWVYTSEIFPLRLRAQGASLGTATNRVMSGVISMSFLSLYKAITISGSFFLYAGIASAGWGFFYVFLPETRGRSLENMEEIFGKKGKEQGKAEEMVAGGEGLKPDNVSV
ncbi:Polyol transporter 5 [Apostasia shenzhenica]|uniref:Polyol transporter 5 n=1 Tax=Apostasia shenzhenica TaxID=1088818 RepID=A0A2I0ARM3_9ASPA|nr:Polyol transporter 5 [Apostasia shenzhenica]